MRILHFLPIFHKNLDVFFFNFPNIHGGNTLVIDNMPHKSMFNGLYNAIFFELFDNIHGEDQYLLGSIIPYLENLHSSEYDIPTFVEHNPFGRIKYINLNNPGLF
jgi:hypothetical protein